MGWWLPMALLLAAVLIAGIGVAMVGQAARQARQLVVAKTDQDDGWSPESARPIHIDVDVAAEPPQGLIGSLAALKDAVAGIGDQLSGTLKVQVSGEGPGCCTDGQLEEDVRAALRSVNEFLKSGGCRVEQLTSMDFFPNKKHEHPKQCEGVAEQFEKDLNKRRLSHLVLVGRADRMPFDDVRYGGNRGLAQARAKWMHGCLRDRFDNRAGNLAEVLEKRTMLLSAGPLHAPACSEEGADPDCDEEERGSDRGVDVFACLHPSEAPPAQPPAPAAQEINRPQGAR